MTNYRLPGTITQPPAAFTQWLSDNQDRLAKAAARGTTPYFVKDNLSYIGDTPVPASPALQAGSGGNDGNPPTPPPTTSPEAPDDELAKKIEERRMQYEELKANPEYTDVEFDETNGGLRAAHIHHNFDKKGGVYELSAQTAGFNAGHSVILESERGKDARFTEGLWDGAHFEVAGRETGTSNNILRGLKHCAEKKQTEIAVLEFPKENFDETLLKNALIRYRGLEKLNDGQYLKFKKIICTQGGKIIYEIEF